MWFFAGAWLQRELLYESLTAPRVTRLPEGFLQGGILSANLILGMGAALLFAAGVRITWTGLLAYLCFAVAMNGNLLQEMIHTQFVGWSVVALAVAARPEQTRLAAILVVGGAYSYLGLTKLFSPHWWTPQPIIFAMDYAGVNISLGPGALTALGFLAAGVETLALPALLWRRTNPWMTGLLTMMQLFIISVIGLIEIGVSMILIHAMLWRGRNDR